MNNLLRFTARHADAWVRLLGVTWPAKTEVRLHFTVEAGRGGRRLATWLVSATGVREYSIEDANGGGLRVSGASHPVVRQHLDALCSLRFRGPVKNPDYLACNIWAAHIDAVDDWIAPDRYLPAMPKLRKTLAQANGLVCRGPLFLLRRYAAVLGKSGVRTTTAILRPKPSAARPRLLHFGNSFVVADRLVAVVEEADERANKRLHPTAARN